MTADHKASKNRTGVTLSKLKSYSNQPASTASVPTGMYHFQIIKATLCEARNGLPFAKFDLIILDGPLKHQRLLANCFAYNPKSKKPKEYGLGMLGTLGESKSTVSSLRKCVRSLLTPAVVGEASG